MFGIITDSYLSTSRNYNLFQMKTHAKQTRKMNGTSSLMVMGILFLTALPLSNMEAGGLEENAAKSLIITESPESELIIQNWMVVDMDWLKDEMRTEDDRIEELSDWMLSADYFKSDWHYDVAELLDADPKHIDGWMLEPSGWNSELAFLPFYL